MLRAISAVLALSGALLLAYGWWGLATAAGQRRYDEMAGMIPLGIAALGALLLIAGGVLALFATRRRGGSGGSHG